MDIGIPIVHLSGSPIPPAGFIATMTDPTGSAVILGGTNDRLFLAGLLSAALLPTVTPVLGLRFRDTDL